MWSGSFLFSKSNGKSVTNQQKVSPFGAASSSASSSVHRSGGGVVPPILLEENRVPKFYKDCLASCGAINASQLPNTGLVYNLMVASQLSRDALSDIWNMVNRTMPGQLTRSEFFSCLALIALAQKGENISALCNISTLPIPHLQTFTEGGIGKVPSKQNSQNSKPPVIETSDLKMKTKAAPIQSSKKEIHDNIIAGGKKNNKLKNNFIPSDLIHSKQQEEEKKEANNETMLVDLIGDFCSTDQISQTIPEPREEMTSFGLLDLDFTLPSENSREPTPKLETTDLDPYAVLREATTEDEYYSTWQQILTEGVKILGNSINLLENSPTSAEEISETEEGTNFIKSISAIAEVLNRVALSTFKHRSGNTAVIDDAKDVLLLWKDLSKKPYIVEAVESIEDEAFTSFNGISGFTAAYPTEQIFCGICIHQISFDDSSFIQFADFNYHSTCANFWANIIDISLPKLGKL